MYTHFLPDRKRLVRHIGRREVLSAVLLLIVGIPLTFSLAEGSEWGDVPALKGLDFSKVEISTQIAVQTDHDSGDGHRLFSHVTTRLREHKLVESPAK